MRKIIVSVFFLFIFIFLFFRIANPFENKRVKFSIPPSNLASVQRGAKYFMNYCSGCHSLQYMRYNRLGVDLNIDDPSNSAPQQRLKDNLVFTQAKTSDTIKSSLHKKESLLWFGKPPPDLSLSIRARSADWVYNYLLSFYLDDTRPFGVNNSFIKNTAMPDPLAIIRMDTNTYHTNINDRSSLKIINRTYSHSNKSRLKTPMLEGIVIDLVNFLAYTAEPTKNNRQSLGKKVCGFLLLLTYFVYLLKKQIWGNIEKINIFHNP
ncbi:MAG: cytochrome c1 [Candidatus Rickettsiella isopodorum]|jgi:ubiquinol-cytochrome c reductase cytochrome c1 subunit|nr:cytochrome c1 [Candidatus Rickettsiella isopodorum]